MCGISAVVTLGQRSQNTASGPNQQNKKAKGVADANNSYEDTLETEVNESLDRITHRGPDARGIWIGSQGKVGEEFDISSLMHCATKACVFSSWCF
jgi:asparagine synthetase B (glutamine-hydrolysing)